MKSRSVLWLCILVIAAVFAVGCGKPAEEIKPEEKKPAKEAPAQEKKAPEGAHAPGMGKAKGKMPAGHPAVGQPKSAPSQLAGTIVDTMDSGGYTYVEVDTGKEKHWAAGPQTPVKKGDKVNIGGLMAMQNFKSKTLDRTFPQIFFVQKIQVISE